LAAQVLLSAHSRTPTHRRKPSRHHRASRAQESGGSGRPAGIRLLELREPNGRVRFQGFHHVHLLRRVIVATRRARGSRVRRRGLGGALSASRARYSGARAEGRPTDLDNIVRSYHRAGGVRRVTAGAAWLTFTAPHPTGSGARRTIARSAPVMRQRLSAVRGVGSTRRWTRPCEWLEDGLAWPLGRAFAPLNREPVCRNYNATQEMDMMEALKPHSPVWFAELEKTNPSRPPGPTRFLRSRSAMMSCSVLRR